MVHSEHPLMIMNLLTSHILCHSWLPKAILLPWEGHIGWSEQIWLAVRSGNMWSGWHPSGEDLIRCVVTVSWYLSCWLKYSVLNHTLILQSYSLYTPYTDRTQVVDESTESKEVLLLFHGSGCGTVKDIAEVHFSALGKSWNSYRGWKTYEMCWRCSAMLWEYTNMLMYTSMK